MKILQICSRVPYPPHDGGAIATFSITKNLIRQGCDVHLLSINTPKHYFSENTLENVPKFDTVFVNTNINLWGLFTGLFGKVPYNIKRFISKNFENKLIDILEKNSFDVIHFEGLFVAGYVKTVKKYSKAKMVLRAHNIEYLLWKRLSANTSNPFKKWYLKKMSDDIKIFEKNYLNLFDLILTISENDKERMEGHLACKTKMEIIPYGIDADEIKVNKSKNNNSKKVGFLGSLNWMPNLEGLEWFLNSVWKKLIKLIPDAEFHIAGKGINEDLKNLSITNVFFHGFIENSHEFLDSCKIMVVPLLSGSGIRVKIIEQMAHGKCIISTRVGAEGIPVTNRENIILADRADLMIQCIQHLFANPGEIDKIGNNARKFVCENFDNSVLIKKLIGIYERMIVN